jgi:hypothetical protein
MSRGFTPDNPPKSGISSKLWRKFTEARFWYDGNEKPADVPPDMLISIMPGQCQRDTGAARYCIEWGHGDGIQRGEILILD